MGKYSVAEASMLHYAADIHYQFPKEVKVLSVFIKEDSSTKFTKAIESLIKNKPNKLARQFINWNKVCRERKNEKP